MSSGIRGQLFQILAQHSLQAPLFASVSTCAFTTCHIIYMVFLSVLLRHYGPV